ncbi:MULTISPECIES: RidA family protein [Actinoplanes]|uniref:RidA family protein n=1 Tax=Actinoplanes TaxID=1865 RepID=UPI0005F283FA|nr:MULTISPECIES: RidA family protein [Actinoplanes]GLY07836.1 enamine deaminase RidA [Actinoplanes sp. NBRC 101535]
MILRNPTGVHAPVADYSHQIEVPAGGRWLVLSGQIGMTPDGTVPGDPVEQITEALANISRNLEAAGMTVRDLVKLTFYLVGAVDAAGRRAAVTTWLGGHEPCTTLLHVSALADPALVVEIDAWAYTA